MDQAIAVSPKLLRRRARKQEYLLRRKQRSILRLPNEMLLEVILRCEPHVRAAMEGTCRRLRDLIHAHAEVICNRTAITMPNEDVRKEDPNFSYRDFALYAPFDVNILRSCLISAEPRSFENFRGNEGRSMKLNFDKNLERDVLYIDEPELLEEDDLFTNYAMELRFDSSAVEKPLKCVYPFPVRLQRLLAVLKPRLMVKWSGYTRYGSAFEEERHKFAAIFDMNDKNAATDEFVSIKQFDVPPGMNCKEYVKFRYEMSLPWQSKYKLDFEIYHPAKLSSSFMFKLDEPAPLDSQ